MNRRNLQTAGAASLMLPGAVVARQGGQAIQPDADLLKVYAAYYACEASRPAANLALVCGTPECDRHEAPHEATQSARTRWCMPSPTGRP